MNKIYKKINKTEIPEKYNLFLDDDENRIPQKLSWCELPFVNWIIVRTHDEFIECVANHGLPVMVSFDHDLADNHYQEYHRANEGDKKLDYNNYKEKTGYHVAQWLAQYCIDNKLKLPVYFVHSMNYMGKQNIISVMESAEKFIKSSN